MYNWNEIGERIRFERKKKNMSMDALAESIGTSRQTIARWERGEGVEVTLNMLLRLCNIFECDIGYLLCEYDCKTRVITDLQEETGLSVLAATNLEVVANAPLDGPMNEDVLDSHRDNLRRYEIGRFAKIRLLEALLENDNELEKIAVAAFDYLNQMRNYKIDPFHTIGGIRHDQFAGIAKQEAIEALADLFEKIVKDYGSSRYYEWEGK